MYHLLKLCIYNIRRLSCREAHFLKFAKCQSMLFVDFDVVHLREKHVYEDENKQELSSFYCRTRSVARALIRITFQRWHSTLSHKRDSSRFHWMTLCVFVAVRITLCNSAERKFTQWVSVMIATCRYLVKYWPSCEILLLWLSWNLCFPMLTFYDVFVSFLFLQSDRNGLTCSWVLEHYFLYVCIESRLLKTFLANV